MALQTIAEVAVIETDWTEDVALGSTSIAIQNGDDYPMLVQFGSNKPASTVHHGFEIPAREFAWFGEPHFVAGDKIYLRMRLRPGRAAVSRT